MNQIANSYAEHRARVTQERAEQMEVVRLFNIPAERRVSGPFTAKRLYRGKEQFVFGYEWSRPYAHFMKGLVNEAVLGWGDTKAAAIAKARDRAQNRQDTPA